MFLYVLLNFGKIKTLTKNICIQLYWSQAKSTH